MDKHGTMPSLKHGAEFNVLRKCLICRGVALLVSIGMTSGILYLNLFPYQKIKLLFHIFPDKFDLEGT